MDQKKDLVEIVYVSVARYVLSQDDLQKILLQSRKNNQKLHLTGLLLYHKNMFLQVLEGPRANAIKMYQVISKDSRHFKVKTLSISDIDDRSFSAWSMGFVSIDGRHEQLEEYFSILNRPVCDSYIKNAKAATAKLLHYFRYDDFRNHIL